MAGASEDRGTGEGTMEDEGDGLAGDVTTGELKEVLGVFSGTVGFFSHDNALFWASETISLRWG